MKKKSKQKFTLMELLVVMTIITILLSISFVSIGYVNRKMHETNVRSAISVLRATIQGFYETHKRWPNIFAPHETFVKDNESEETQLLSGTSAHALIFVFGEFHDPEDPNKNSITRGLWEIEVPSSKSTQKRLKMLLGETEWRRISHGVNFKKIEDATASTFSNAHAMRDLWNNLLVVRMTKKMSEQVANYGNGNKPNATEYDNTRASGGFDIFSTGEDGKEYDEKVEDMENDDVWPEN